MTKTDFIIEYSVKVHSELHGIDECIRYDSAIKAYFFDIGVSSGILERLGVDSLKDYVDFTYDCYLAHEHFDSPDQLAMYVSARWGIKELDVYNLVDEGDDNN